MQKKNKISRISSFVLSAVITGLFGVTAYYDNKIPDIFYVESGNARCNMKLKNRVIIK